MLLSLSGSCAHSVIRAVLNVNFSLHPTCILWFRGLRVVHSLAGTISSTCCTSYKCGFIYPYMRKSLKLSLRHEYGPNWRICIAGQSFAFVADPKTLDIFSATEVVAISTVRYRTSRPGKLAAYNLVASLVESLPKLSSLSSSRATPMHRCVGSS